MKVLLNAYHNWFSSGTDTKIPFDLVHLAQEHEEICIQTIEDPVYSVINNLRFLMRRLLDKSGHISGRTFLIRAINLIPKWVIRNHSPDLIYSHGFCPINIRASGVPIVWQTSFSPKQYLIEKGGNLRERRFEIEAKRLIAQRANCILVAVPSYAARLASALPEAADRIQTIPFYMPYIEPLSAEDLDAKHESGARVRLLFVGNEAYRKGLPNLLKAYNALPRLMKKQVEFIVVSRLDDGKIAIPKGVRLLQNIPRKRVVQLMRESQIFAFPSYAETFGIVLVEAMASGCAIIGSEYEPMDYVLGNGNAGVLVDPKDVDSVACALSSLIMDHSLRQALSRKALDRFRNVFYHKVVGQQYVEVFTEVYDSRGISK